MPNTNLPAGAKRLPDTARYSNRIQVSSDSTAGKTYIVGYNKSTGRFECTCPHYVFRCRGKNAGPDVMCKHLARLQRFLGAASSPEMTTPKTRKPARRKAIKAAPAVSMPLAVWTAEEVREAALEFAV